MKITLVSHNYLPFVGGIETHVQQVAHELKARGHDVHILAANFVHPKLPDKLSVLNETLLAPSSKDYVDDGVQVHAISPSPGERILLIPTVAQVIPVLRRYLYHQLRDWTYFWYRSVYLRRVRQVLRGSDVVHSLTYSFFGWTARQAARDLKIPFVCTPFVHPGQWGDGPDDVSRLKTVDAVIGLVETDSNYLASLGISRDKIHTIGVSPNLPSIQASSNFRRQHHLEDVPIILYVGRMMPQKGAEAVLKSAPLVWEHHPNVHFVFMGPASVESEKWFADTDARVHYLGKTSQQEKADAIAECSIFCMPSMSEILPTVYLEAWSLGKPVVGGHAHGLVELVEGNKAGLCSSQDPAELAITLNGLLSDEKQRDEFGVNGAHLVERLYTRESVAGQLEALYSSVVK